MRDTILTSILALLSGCAIQHPAAFEPTAPPHVGQPVQGTSAKAVDNSQIMAASSQFWPKYDLVANQIKFVLGVDDAGIVRYVSTDQAGFSTPDGIRVGDTYCAVTKVAGVNAIAEPGWAFHVQLPSGWFAAFTQGESMTDGSLAADARVRWVFQR